MEEVHVRGRALAHDRQLVARRPPTQTDPNAKQDAVEDAAEVEVAVGRRALLFEILPHPLSLFRAVLRRPVRGVDWRVVASTDDDLDVGGTCDGVLLRARISLRGRPTRNELTVVGERGTAHVDLFHGFSVVESRAPSRRSKLVQPFARGQKLVAAAAANLAVRAVRSEPAYPGLRELIAAFYLGVRSNGRAPIADDEAVEVAEIVDRLRASPAA